MLSTTNIIVLLFAMPNFISSNNSCKNLFKEDYVAFLYLGVGVQIIEDITVTTKSEEIQGQLNLSMCGSFQIPPKCGVEGKAQLVFIPNESTDCIIIKDQQKWDFTKNL